MDSNWTASAPVSGEAHVGQREGVEEASQDANAGSSESQPVLQEQVGEVSVELEEGHVTTDSSCSSGDEISA